MAGGVMTNNGPLFVGKGLRGSLVITNTGTWYQNASTYVGGYYNYNGTVAEPGTGTMTVAAGGLFLSASNVLVASYGGGSNAIGSLTVSNATFISTNSNTALKIGTNGVVTVCGTQRVFQVAALTNFAGIFSNNIAQVAGGLDITTTNAGALTLTNNGLATLVFSQNPVAPGNFWGLRWLGTNHVAALTAMHAASQLTWNDSQLSANYRGLSGIYTDAVYTYVGFKLNALPVNGTSMFFW